ncbi:MAG: hypothetical protein EZS28_002554 [Streblomastix strix]|uniref:Uncharacterized protein n=1 Tax=Streblomastix strix TaxID=222440 RepID=A0A5J4X3X6_9EUKA|nr:MAG: hypothetical protein EZS28_002554 [Streblomastix strix]
MQQGIIPRNASTKRIIDLSSSVGMDIRSLRTLNDIRSEELIKQMQNINKEYVELRREALKTQMRYIAPAKPRFLKLTITELIEFSSCFNQQTGEFEISPGILNQFLPGARRLELKLSQDERKLMAGKLEAVRGDGITLEGIDLGIGNDIWAVPEAVYIACAKMLAEQIDTAQGSIKDCFSFFHWFGQILLQFCKVETFPMQIQVFILVIRIWFSKQLYQMEKFSQEEQNIQLRNSIEDTSQVLFFCLSLLISIMRVKNPAGRDHAIVNMFVEKQSLIFKELREAFSQQRDFAQGKKLGELSKMDQKNVNVEDDKRIEEGLLTSRSNVVENDTTSLVTQDFSAVATINNAIKTNTQPETGTLRMQSKGKFGEEDLSISGGGEFWDQTWAGRDLVRGGGGGSTVSGSGNIRSRFGALTIQSQQLWYLDVENGQDEGDEDLEEIGQSNILGGTSSVGIPGIQDDIEEIEREIALLDDELAQLDDEEQYELKIDNLQSQGKLKFEKNSTNQINQQIQLVKQQSGTKDISRRQLLEEKDRKKKIQLEQINIVKKYLKRGRLRQKRLEGEIDYVEQEIEEVLVQQEEERADEENKRIQMKGYSQPTDENDQSSSGSEESDSEKSRRKEMAEMAEYERERQREEEEEDVDMHGREDTNVDEAGSLSCAQMFRGLVRQLIYLFYEMIHAFTNLVMYYTEMGQFKQRIHHMRFVDSETLRLTTQRIQSLKGQVKVSERLIHQSFSGQFIFNHSTAGVNKKENDRQYDDDGTGQLELINMKRLFNVEIEVQTSDISLDQGDMKKKFYYGLEWTPSTKMLNGYPSTVTFCKVRNILMMSLIDANVASARICGPILIVNDEMHRAAINIFEDFCHVLGHNLYIYQCTPRDDMNFFKRFIVASLMDSHWILFDGVEVLPPIARRSLTDFLKDLIKWKNEHIGSQEGFVMLNMEGLQTRVTLPIQDWIVCAIYKTDSVVDARIPDRLDTVFRIVTLPQFTTVEILGPLFASQGFVYSVHHKQKASQYMLGITDLLCYEFKETNAQLKAKLLGFDFLLNIADSAGCYLRQIIHSMRSKQRRIIWKLKQEMEERMEQWERKSYNSQRSHGGRSNKNYQMMQNIEINQIMVFQILSQELDRIRMLHFPFISHKNPETVHMCMNIEEQAIKAALWRATLAIYESIVPMGVLSSTHTSNPLTDEAKPPLPPLLHSLYQLLEITFPEQIIAMQTDSDIHISEAAAEAQQALAKHLSESKQELEKKKMNEKNKGDTDSQKSEDSNESKKKEDVTGKQENEIEDLEIEGIEETEKVRNSGLVQYLNRLQSQMRASGGISSQNSGKEIIAITSVTSMGGSVQGEGIQYEKFCERVRPLLQKMNLVDDSAFMEKLWELYVVMQRDWFVVVNGPSGSGKSTLLNVLRQLYIVDNKQKLYTQTLFPFLADITRRIRQNDILATQADGSEEVNFYSPREQMRAELFENLIQNRQFHMKVQKKKGHIYKYNNRKNQNKYQKGNDKEQNGNHQIERRAIFAEEVEETPPIWIILQIQDGKRISSFDTIMQKYFSATVRIDGTMIELNYSNIKKLILPKNSRIIIENRTSLLALAPSLAQHDPIVSVNFPAMALINWHVESWGRSMVEEIEDVELLDASVLLLRTSIMSCLRFLNVDQCTCDHSASSSAAASAVCGSAISVAAAKAVRIPVCGLIQTTKKLLSALIKLHNRNIQTKLDMKLLQMYIYYSVIWGTAGHLKAEAPTLHDYTRWYNKWRRDHQRILNIGMGRIYSGKGFSEGIEYNTGNESSKSAFIHGASGEQTESSLQLIQSNNNSGMLDLDLQQQLRQGIEGEGFFNDRTLLSQLDKIATEQIQSNYNEQSGAYGEENVKDVRKQKKRGQTSSNEDEDQSLRHSFDRWFRETFGESIEFGKTGSVFDYFIDSKEKKMVHVTRLQPENTVFGFLPLQNNLPKIITQFLPLLKMSYPISLLVYEHRPIVMLEDLILDGISLSNSIALSMPQITEIAYPKSSHVSNFCKIPFHLPFIQYVQAQSNNYKHIFEYSNIFLLIGSNQAVSRCPMHSFVFHIMDDRRVEDMNSDQDNTNENGTSKMGATFAALIESSNRDQVYDQNLYLRHILAQNPRFFIVKDEMFFSMPQAVNSTNYHATIAIPFPTAPELASLGESILQGSRMWQILENGQQQGVPIHVAPAQSPLDIKNAENEIGINIKSEVSSVYTGDQANSEVITIGASAPPTPGLKQDIIQQLNNQYIGQQKADSISQKSEGGGTQSQTENSGVQGDDESDEEGEDGIISVSRKRFYFGNILPATIYVYLHLLNGNIGQEKPTLTQFVNVLRAVCNANTSVIFDEAALSSLWLWECERMYVLCQPTRRMQLYVLETCNHAFRMFFPQFVDIRLERFQGFRRLKSLDLNSPEQQKNQIDKEQKQGEKQQLEEINKTQVGKTKQEVDSNSTKQLEGMQVANDNQQSKIQSQGSANMSKDLVEQVDGFEIGDNETLTSDGILRLQFDVFSPNSSQRATVIDTSIIPANIQLHEMLMEDPNEDRNKRIKHAQENEENQEDGLVNENEFIDKEDLQAFNHVGQLAFSQTLQRTFMQLVESLQESSTPLFIVDTEGRNGQDFLRVGSRLLNKKVTFCDFPFELSRISTFLDILAEFIVENGFNDKGSLLYFDQCKLNKHIAKQGIFLYENEALNNHRQSTPGIQIPHRWGASISTSQISIIDQLKEEDFNNQYDFMDNNSEIEKYIDPKTLDQQHYERILNHVQQFGMEKLTNYPAKLKSFFVVQLGNPDSALSFICYILFEIFYGMQISSVFDNKIFQPLLHDSLKAREIRSRKEDPEVHLEYLYGRITYFLGLKRKINKVNSSIMKEVLYNLVRNSRLVFTVSINNKINAESFLAQFKNVWTLIYTPIMDAESFKEMALHTLKPILHNLASYLISEEVPAFITTQTSAAAVNGTKISSSMAIGSTGSIVSIRQSAGQLIKQLTNNQIKFRKSNEENEDDQLNMIDVEGFNNQFISAFSKDGSLNKKQRILAVAIIESLTQIQQKACSLSELQGAEKNTWCHNGKDPVIGTFTVDRPSFSQLIDFVQYFGHFLYVSVKYQQHLISKLVSSLTILSVFKKKLERLRTTTDQSTTLFQSINVAQQYEYRIANLHYVVHIRTRELRDLDSELVRNQINLQKFENNLNGGFVRPHQVEKAKIAAEDAMQSLRQLTQDGVQQIRAIGIGNVVMGESSYSILKLFELVSLLVVRGDEKERALLFGICSPSTILDSLWSLDVFSVPYNIVREINMLLEVAYTWDVLPQEPIFANVLFKWLRGIVFVALEGRNDDEGQNGLSDYIQTIVKQVIFKARQKRLKRKIIDLDKEIIRSKNIKQELTENPNLINEALQRSRSIVLNSEKLLIELQEIESTTNNDLARAYKELHTCIGDSILAASFFIFYQFPMEIRRIFIQEHVIPTIMLSQIPISNDRDPIAFLSHLNFDSLISEQYEQNVVDYDIDTPLTPSRIHQNLSNYFEEIDDGLSEKDDFEDQKKDDIFSLVTISSAQSEDITDRESITSFITGHGLSLINVPYSIIDRVSPQLSLFCDNYGNNQSIYTRSAQELAKDINQDNGDQNDGDNTLSAPGTEIQNKYNNQIFPDQLAQIAQKLNIFERPFRFSYSGQQRHLLEVFMRLKSGGIMKTAGRNSIFKLFGVQHPSTSPLVVSLSNTDSYKKIIQALKEVSQVEIQNVMIAKKKSLKKAISRSFFEQIHNTQQEKRIKAIFITDVCDSTVDERMFNFLKQIANKFTNCRTVEPISIELENIDENDDVDTKSLQSFNIPPDTVIILIAKMGPGCSFFSMWNSLCYPIIIAPNEELFRAGASIEIGEFVSKQLHHNGAFNSIIESIPLPSQRSYNDQSAYQFTNSPNVSYFNNDPSQIFGKNQGTQNIGQIDSEMTADDDNIDSLFPTQHRTALLETQLEVHKDRLQKSLNILNRRDVFPHLKVDEGCSSDEFSFLLEKAVIPFLLPQVRQQKVQLQDNAKEEEQEQEEQQNQNKQNELLTKQNSSSSETKPPLNFLDKSVKMQQQVIQTTASKFSASTFTGDTRLHLEQEIEKERNLEKEQQQQIVNEKKGYNINQESRSIALSKNSKDPLLETIQDDQSECTKTLERIILMENALTMIINSLAWNQKEAETLSQNIKKLKEKNSIFKLQKNRMLDSLQWLHFCLVWEAYHIRPLADVVAMFSFGRIRMVGYPVSINSPNFWGYEQFHHILGDILRVVNAILGQQMRGLQSGDQRVKDIWEGNDEDDDEDERQTEDENSNSSDDDTLIENNNNLDRIKYEPQSVLFMEMIRQYMPAQTALLQMSGYIPQNPVSAWLPTTLWKNIFVLAAVCPIFRPLVEDLYPHASNVYNMIDRNLNIDVNHSSNTVFEIIKRVSSAREASKRGAQEFDIFSDNAASDEAALQIADSDGFAITSKNFDSIISEIQVSGNDSILGGFEQDQHLFKTGSGNLIQSSVKLQKGHNMTKLSSLQTDSGSTGEDIGDGFNNYEGQDRMYLDEQNKEQMSHIQKQGAYQRMINRSDDNLSIHALKFNDILSRVKAWRVDNEAVANMTKQTGKQHQSGSGVTELASDGSNQETGTGVINMTNQQKAWIDWINDERPELAELPNQTLQSTLNPFQRLILLNCLCPYRVHYAAKVLIASQPMLGIEAAYFSSSLPQVRANRVINVQTDTGMQNKRGAARGAQTNVGQKVQVLYSNTYAYLGPSSLEQIFQVPENISQKMAHLFKDRPTRNGMIVTLATIGTKFSQSASTTRVIRDIKRLSHIHSTQQVTVISVIEQYRTVRHMVELGGVQKKQKEARRKSLMKQEEEIGQKKILNKKSDNKKSDIGKEIAMDLYQKDDEYVQFLWQTVWNETEQILQQKFNAGGWVILDGLSHASFSFVRNFREWAMKRFELTHKYSSADFQNAERFVLWLVIPQYIYSSPLSPIYSQLSGRFGYYTVKVALRRPLTFRSSLCINIIDAIRKCPTDKIGNVARYYDNTATRESLPYRLIVHLLFILVCIHTTLGEYARTRGSTLNNPPHAFNENAFSSLLRIVMITVSNQGTTYKRGLKNSSNVSFSDSWVWIKLVDNILNRVYPHLNGCIPPQILQNIINSLLQQRSFSAMGGSLVFPGIPNPLQETYFTDLNQYLHAVLNSNVINSSDIHYAALRMKEKESTHSSIVGSLLRFTIGSKDRLQSLIQSTTTNQIYDLNLDIWNQNVQYSLFSTVLMRLMISERPFILESRMNSVISSQTAVYHPAIVVCICDELLEIIQGRLFNVEALTAVVQAVCMSEDNIPPTAMSMLREANAANVILARIHAFLSAVPSFLKSILSSSNNTSLISFGSATKEFMVHVQQLVKLSRSAPIKQRLATQQFSSQIRSRSSSTSENMDDEIYQSHQFDHQNPQRNQRRQSIGQGPLTIQSGAAFAQELANMGLIERSPSLMQLQALPQLRNQSSSIAFPSKSRLTPRLEQDPYDYIQSQDHLKQLDREEIGISSVADSNAVILLLLGDGRRTVATAVDSMRDFQIIAGSAIHPEMNLNVITYSPSFIDTWCAISKGEAPTAWHALSPHEVQNNTYAIQIRRIQRGKEYAEDVDEGSRTRSQLVPFVNNITGRLEQLHRFFSFVPISQRLKGLNKRAIGTSSLISQGEEALNKSLGIFPGLLYVGRGFFVSIRQELARTIQKMLQNQSQIDMHYNTSLGEKINQAKTGFGAAFMQLILKLMVVQSGGLLDIRRLERKRRKQNALINFASSANIFSSAFARIALESIQRIQSMPQSQTSFSTQGNKSSFGSIIGSGSINREKWEHLYQGDSSTLRSINLPQHMHMTPSRSKISLVDQQSFRRNSSMLSDSFSTLKLLQLDSLSKNRSGNQQNYEFGSFRNRRIVTSASILSTITQFTNAGQQWTQENSENAEQQILFAIAKQRQKRRRSILALLIKSKLRQISRGRTHARAVRPVSFADISVILIPAPFKTLTDIAIHVQLFGTVSNPISPVQGSFQSSTEIITKSNTSQQIQIAPSNVSEQSKQKKASSNKNVTLINAFISENKIKMSFGLSSRLFGGTFLGGMRIICPQGFGFDQKQKKLVAYRLAQSSGNQSKVNKRTRDQEQTEIRNTDGATEEKELSDNYQNKNISYILPNVNKYVSALNQPDASDFLNQYSTAANVNAFQLPFMRTGIVIRAADGSLVTVSGDVVSSERWFQNIQSAIIDTSFVGTRPNSNCILSLLQDSRVVAPPQGVNDYTTNITILPNDQGLNTTFTTHV